MIIPANPEIGQAILQYENNMLDRQTPASVSTILPILLSNDGWLAHDTESTPLNRIAFCAVNPPRYQFLQNALEG